MGQFIYRRTEEPERCQAAEEDIKDYNAEYSPNFLLLWL